MAVACEQLVILHHHLNPGGVTRVIQNHLLSLEAAWQAQLPEHVLLLHGGRAEGWPSKELSGPLPFTLECQVVEGLDYDDAPATHKLGTSIQAALTLHGCTPENTLLHWHNHSLGKNTSTPLAVRQLAEQGYRTLLQIHDFAEDFRPDNYRKLAAALSADKIEKLPESLYPQAEHIHYAALNRRDYQILANAGVNDAQCHLLPNPVAAAISSADATDARNLVRQTLSVPLGSRLLTYPVRGIRRKNLGELLLWSATVNNAFFHVSLAPESPAERNAFDDWAKFSQELSLPCQLGRPEEAEFSFDELLAASDALVTTSVAEGFGMVFLEAWLVGKRLLGRNLPEISDDFCKPGLQLGDLYDKLLIPTEWVDRQNFLQQFGNVVSCAYDDFGLPPIGEADLRRQLGSMLEESAIDFACLPIALQRGVIRRVREDASIRQHLLELNPRLRLPVGDAEERVAANAEIVRDNYSPSKLGNCLSEVYAALERSSVKKNLTPPAHGQTVLNSFLQIDRLYPVRMES